MLRYSQRESPALGGELSDLSKLVKAYDVRGVVPDQLNETVARALGTAFVEMLRESGDEAERIVIAHDMRETGPALAAAFAAGANAAGAAVVHIGLGSTDQLYYASGVLGLPGAMFTASHNPAQYNGIKLCRSGARPVGQDSGLAIVRMRAEELLGDLDAVAIVPPAVEERNLLADYARHLRSLVDLSGIRPLKVVVDAGN